MTLDTFALILAVLLFALNVADALLTDAVIARGGRETIPWVRWFMLQPLTRPFRWAVKLAIVVGIAWLAIAGVTIPTPWGALELRAVGWQQSAILAPFVALFGWIVWHNAMALRRQLARTSIPPA